MIKKEICYNKIKFLIIERNVEFAKIRKATGIGSSTITKIKRNQEVSLDILLRICGFFNCNIGDICDAITTKGENSDEWTAFENCHM